jgi:hypothetical protein
MAEGGKAKQSKGGWTGPFILALILAGGVAQMVEQAWGPEFKPYCHKKKSIMALILPMKLQPSRVNQFLEVLPGTMEIKFQHEFWRGQITEP